MEPKTPDQEKKQLETVDIPAIEIFSEGSWNGDIYSHDDLQAMVDAFGQVGFEPTVKAGHADGQEDEKKARLVFGAPALGYAKRIYLSGRKLIADLTQVPRRFADLVKAGAFKKISAEIYWAYKHEASGKTFPRVLKSIAFLGAEIPALTDLKAIEALYEKNAAGSMFAYDEKGNEFHAYDYQMEMPPITSSFEFPRFLIGTRRKAKAAVNYLDLAAADAQCGDCRYYVEAYDACTLVEGYIEWDDGCDLFEADTENYASKQKPKRYTVEKRGDQWCLIAKSTGKTLGCVIGDTEVWGPKAYRSTSRWYEGEIVEISIAAGQKLAVTPNHPILTPHGFIPAGVLNKGDQVVGAIRREREKFGDPDDYQMPAAIKDIAASFGECVSVTTRAVPVAPEDFHGDGIGSEVCVVRTNRPIDDGLNSDSTERGAQSDFIIRGRIRSSLASESAPDQGLLADFQDAIFLHPFDYSAPRLWRKILPESPNCVGARMERMPSPLYASGNDISTDLITGGDLGGALAGCISLDEDRRVKEFETGAERNLGTFEPEIHGIDGDAALSSDLINSYAGLIGCGDFIDGRPYSRQTYGLDIRSDQDTLFAQGIFDCPEMDAVNLAKTMEGLPGDVCVREIVAIRRLPFSGHVYNLSTVPGYYVASDIIVHNCHDSKEKAQAQEAAIKANKHSAGGVLVTLEQMKEICPSCAERMEFSNLKAVRIGKYLNLPEGTISALCDKFGASEGFRTRCMDSSIAGKMDDAGAFCNALKQECFNDSGAARVHTEDAMIKLHMTRDEVSKICQPCGKQMEEKGISALTFTAEQVTKFAAMDMPTCMADAKMVKDYPDEGDRKTACQGQLGKAMMDAIQETKGGPNMDEKKFQEEKAQLIADKKAADDKAKEYQDKLASLEAANEEARGKESEALQEVKKLKRERHDDQTRAWIAAQKRAGKLAPVEEARLAAIFSALYEDARVVTFAQADGKEAKEPLADAIKAFIVGRPTIFKELSHADEEPAEPLDDAGEEVDRKTKEHMAKNGMKVGQYAEAMKAVLALKENEDLAVRWVRMQRQ